MLLGTLTLAADDLAVTLVYLRWNCVWSTHLHSFSEEKIFT